MRQQDLLKGFLGFLVLHHHKAACCLKKWAALFENSMCVIDVLVELENAEMSEVKSMPFPHLLSFHEFNMSRRGTSVSQKHKLAKQM